MCIHHTISRFFNYCNYKIILKQIHSGVMVTIKQKAFYLVISLKKIFKAKSDSNPLSFNDISWVILSFCHICNRLLDCSDHFDLILKSTNFIYLPKPFLLKGVSNSAFAFTYDSITICYIWIF